MPQGLSHGWTTSPLLCQIRVRFFVLVERHSKKKWLLRYLLSNPNHASFITIILNSTNTLQGELGICNYAAERIASAAAKGL